MYRGLRLFKTAFVNTKRQIYVSGVFLVAITFVLTIILYLAESRVDPDFSFWVIIFTEHLKNSVNQVDFHLAESLKDGSQSTISNQHQYAQFCDAFASMVKSEFGFETALHSSRYPLLKKNLGYTIRENYPDCNVFVLRPSSELMNFDDRKLVIAFRMSQLISEQLDSSKGITDDDDVEDFKDTSFGYREQKENNK